jgi:hypothetical protein
LQTFFCKLFLLTLKHICYIKLLQALVSQIYAQLLERVLALAKVFETKYI